MSSRDWEWSSSVSPQNPAIKSLVRLTSGRKITMVWTTWVFEDNSYKHIKTSTFPEHSAATQNLTRLWQGNKYGAWVCTCIHRVKLFTDILENLIDTWDGQGPSENYFRGSKLHKDSQGL